MHEKISFGICTTVMLISLLPGCVSSRLYVSDDTSGITEYQEIQGQIRTGETELASSGSEIGKDSEELGIRIEELRQSIEKSADDESEIGKILSRIEARKIEGNILTEIRIKYPDYQF